jgi:ribonuclease HII
MRGDLLTFELEARSRGAERVCGIDEVGRGCIAGPVVAACVVLPTEFSHPKLTDSKKLTPRQREGIFNELTSLPGLEWSVAFVDSTVIDSINILQATWQAMLEARNRLHLQPDWTLVDGLKVPPLGRRQTAIIQGDSLSFSIAAASVIAKVTRDRWMGELERKYPGYGFAKHKGYGTAFHLEALYRWGPTPLHRRSFEPVRRCFAKDSRATDEFSLAISEC